jgi:hypothetical protein
MGHFFYTLERYVSRIGTQEWAIILLSMIVVGFVCLRGFGSRSGY